MYKRFLLQMFLCNMLFCAGWFCVRGIQANRTASAPAFQVFFAETQVQPVADKSSGTSRKVASGQRVVDYEVLEKEDKYGLSEEDYEILLKIVQAEAGTEDEKGKMLVAGVVLNRVKSPRFPDTVRDVVFQNQGGVYQFSPIANKSYYAVSVTEDTKAAVDRVLMGEDISEGALYFAARKYADSEKMRWFDRALVRLFAYGGHEFFTAG